MATEATEQDVDFNALGHQLPWLFMRTGVVPHFVGLADEKFGLCMVASGDKSEAAIATREDLRSVHDYIVRSRRRSAVDVRCSEAQPPLAAVTFRCRRPRCITSRTLATARFIAVATVVGGSFGDGLGSVAELPPAAGLTAAAVGEHGDLTKHMRRKARCFALPELSHAFGNDFTVEVHGS